MYASGQMGWGDFRRGPKSKGKTGTRSHFLSELLPSDLSHDIRHASEIAIVELRRVYGRILRGVDEQYGRQ